MMSDGRSPDLSRVVERLVDRRQVIAILHAGDVPPVRGEPSSHILGEVQRCRARQRDGIGVVEHDQLAEPEMAGERARLGRDAFHQIAVARDDVRVVVDDRVSRPVEVRGQMRLGHGHADRVRRCPGRGGRWSPRRPRHMALGMPGCPAVPLAESLDLLHRQVVARQMEQRVEQHRPVAGRQHEAVAIGPVRISRIVPQESGPEHVRHRRRSHRESGVTRVGLLHRIDGEEADRVDRDVVGMLFLHGRFLTRLVMSGYRGVFVLPGYTAVVPSAGSTCCAILDEDEEGETCGTMRG